VSCHSALFLQGRGEPSDVFSQQQNRSSSHASFSGNRTDVVYIDDSDD
jgi:hypothetical protein